MLSHREGKWKLAFLSKSRKNHFIFDGSPSVRTHQQRHRQWSRQHSHQMSGHMRLRPGGRWERRGGCQCTHCKRRWPGWARDRTLCGHGSEWLSRQCSGTPSLCCGPGRSSWGSGAEAWWNIFDARCPPEHFVSTPGLTVSSTDGISRNRLFSVHCRCWQHQHRGTSALIENIWCGKFKHKNKITGGIYWGLGSFIVARRFIKLDNLEQEILNKNSYFFSGKWMMRKGLPSCVEVEELETVQSDHEMVRLEWWFLGLCQTRSPWWPVDRVPGYHLMCWTKIILCKIVLCDNSNKQTWKEVLRTRLRVYNGNI